MMGISPAAVQPCFFLVSGKVARCLQQAAATHMSSISSSPSSSLSPDRCARDDVADHIIDTAIHTTMLEKGLLKVYLWFHPVARHDLRGLRGDLRAGFLAVGAPLPRLQRPHDADEEQVGLAERHVVSLAKRQHRDELCIYPGLLLHLGMIGQDGKDLFIMKQDIGGEDEGRKRRGRHQG